MQEFLTQSIKYKLTSTEYLAGFLLDKIYAKTKAIVDTLIAIYNI